MRILNIRFKNLNSLQGEWKIDFTNAAYVSDGIFVITGPTGAGKTTILDAVCLALYGRTPRLEDVTQGGNEIMSRRTGECFAEVVFETEPKDGGRPSRYRVFWEQHKAHKRPDEALQPPRHEIADALTGEILESRQRAVAQKIKEVTGLTFDQFIRSILLAQGNFSAFLQSSPGERSPILEQITGTEIYSQISVRVHEMRNAEREDLAMLESQASGLRDLTPEEREDLEAQLEARRREETVMEETAERYAAELDWLENMAALQKDLSALDDRNRDLTRRQENFDPERKRLERAQQALEFGGTYAALATLRKDQEKDKRALLDWQARGPELEADVRRSEEAVQLAVSAHTERRAEHKNLLDVLRKVRELDTRRKEKEPPILEAQALFEEMTKAVEKLRVRWEKEQAQFENAQIQLRGVRKFLQSNAVDEKLIEQLTGIRARFEALQGLVDKRRASQEKRAAADEQKQDSQKLLGGQSVFYEMAKTKFASAENLIRKQKAALNETLGTRSFADWSESLAELTERKIRQGGIQETLERRAGLLNARQRLRERRETLEASRKDGAKQIDVHRKKIEEIEKETQHLEIQADLIRRIQDLEEARTHLQDGAPCPLCGSAAHPYAEGNVPQADENQFALRNARNELKIAHSLFSDLQIRNAQLDQELIQAGEEDTQLQSQLQTVETQLSENLAELQIMLPMDEDPLTALGRHRQRTEESLQKTRLVVERAEKAEKDLTLAQEELERAREERDQLARSQQEAEFARETAVRECERLAQELRIQDEALKNARTDLIHQTAPFGFKNLPDERPEQVLKTLEARLQKWQEQERLRLDLEKQISVWERDIHHARSSLDSLNLELKDKNEALKKLRAEKDAIQQQRLNLFGAKEPDAEEKTQAELVEAAQKQVDAKREAREKALQEFSNAHSRMEELGKSIHIRADNLQKVELAFKKHLIAGDFRSEDAYLASCLSEEERRVLQERAQALSAERADIDARLMDKKFTLEELRRRQLTELPLEDAIERKLQAAAAQKELQQSIGVLCSRLLDEEKFAEERRALAAAIEKQRKEWRRWEKLHDLIGSADGQKYRNFAQGLTFEMVIRHANRQLRKMTDRYYLVRDEENELELQVVDNYQAGEVRSAKNLSGGESFIVSLALALGLSQMASQKIRVDSLFLDEGFGSLDEEALDMALSTLTSLRQEGKLIGVISHIEALKERIAAKIEVIPQGDGRSVIKGMGTAGG